MDSLAGVSKLVMVSSLSASPYGSSALTAAKVTLGVNLRCLQFHLSDCSLSTCTLYDLRYPEVSETVPGCHLLSWLCIITFEFLRSGLSTLAFYHRISVFLFCQSSFVKSCDDLPL